MLVGLTAPDLPDLPETIRSRPAVAIAGCHVGDAVAAASDLAAVRALEPEADLFGRMSYPDAQQMFDAELPAGHRYYFSGAYLDGLPAGVVEVLTEAIGHAPSTRCEIDLHHMGGAAGRVPEDATAFSGRDAAHVVNTLAGWEDPADDTPHREWVRNTAAALRPFRSSGDYVNFMGDAHAGAGIVDVYGAARLERLLRVKRRLDPRNVFRLNQNIEP